MRWWLGGFKYISFAQWRGFRGVNHPKWPASSPSPPFAPRGSFWLGECSVVGCNPQPTQVPISSASSHNDFLNFILIDTSLEFFSFTSRIFLSRTFIVTILLWQLPEWNCFDHGTPKTPAPPVPQTLLRPRPASPRSLPHPVDGRFLKTHPTGLAWPPLWTQQTPRARAAPRSTAAPTARSASATTASSRDTFVSTLVSFITKIYPPIFWF